VEGRRGVIFLTRGRALGSRAWQIFARILEKLPRLAACWDVTVDAARSVTMEARKPLSPDCPDFDSERFVEPPRRNSGIQTVQERPADDRGSGIRLANNSPTMPPPAAMPEHDIVIQRIHLAPSVDEILYRLSVGDQRGAFEAADDLGPLVPRVTVPRVILQAMVLTHVEEHVLSFVDGESTWDDILDSSPFGAALTLESLCELVDKGAVSPG
jgi:hypothetical protein